MYQRKALKRNSSITCLVNRRFIHSVKEEEPHSGSTYKNQTRLLKILYSKSDIYLIGFRLLPYFLICIFLDCIGIKETVFLIKLGLQGAGLPPWSSSVSQWGGPHQEHPLPEEQYVINGVAQRSLGRDVLNQKWKLTEFHYTHSFGFSSGREFFWSWF